jgi:hypothetical protein
MSSVNKEPNTTITHSNDNDIDDSDNSIYTPENDKKPAARDDHDPPSDDDSDIIVVDDDEIVDEDVQCILCSETSTHAMNEIGAIANSVVHMVGHAIDRISSIATATKKGNNKKKKKRTTYDELGQKFLLAIRSIVFLFV